MKKLCTIIIGFVITLAWVSIASAAGTVTQSYTKTDRYVDETVRELTFSWTGDASDGTVPATATTAAVNGYVFMAVTNPGSTAPTDNYDITLTDADGVDIFGAELSNRDTTNSEQAVPKIGSATYGSRYVNSVLTLNITGNSVVSATGVVRIYIYTQ